MEIRKVVKDDYKELLKLMYQLHQLHYENRPDIYHDLNPFPTKYFNTLLSDKDSFMYAYVEQNTIVGLIVGHKKTTKDIPILRQRKIYYIDNIIVDKNKRGKGIGKALYNYIRKKAQTNNIDTIELNAYSFNKNALKFYKSIGMKERNIIFEEKL